MKKAEYEAQVELAKVREEVIKSKLALEVAQIEESEGEAEEEEEDQDITIRARVNERVSEWLERTPHEPAPAAHTTPAPEGVATRVATQAPEDTPRYGGGQKEERRAAERSTIEELAEVLRGMARPQHVPKQAYELPVFHGDPAEWLVFLNAYRQSTAAYRFTTYENISRITTALRGDARASVEDLLRTSRDPEEVINALSEEYGHPGLLLECAVNKIKCLPKATDSGKELKKIASVLRNCVALLRNIKADGYINNPQLVNEVLAKLTPYQRAQYGDYALKVNASSAVDLRVSPNLNLVLDFVTYISRASAFYVPANLGLTAASATPATRGRDKRAVVTHKVNAVTDNAGKSEENIGKQEENTGKSMEKCSADVKCSMCSENHRLQQCDKFKQLKVSERWDYVRDNKLCFRCVGRAHSRSACRSKQRCEVCKYTHHTLLHMPKNEPAGQETVTLTNSTSGKALLKVIPVIVRTSDGRERETHALLDDGATVSILDAALGGGGEGPAIPLKIVTARGQSVTDSASRLLEVEVAGPNGEWHRINVRTMRNLNLPGQSVPQHVLRDNKHLRDLDCGEMRGAKPMLLLGQDNYELIISRDLKQGKSGCPVASLTKLGWVVHGPVGRAPSSDSEQVNLLSDNDLNSLVREQFELEAIGIRELPRRHAEDDRALDILSKTGRRQGDSWEVGLLWKTDDIDLPDNYEYAKKRLLNVERRMDRDPNYAKLYSQQIDRLLELNYAHKVEKLESTPIWYLPHFGVVNPNKPGKLRLVFDAAATYRGTCLNDNLLTGPDMLNSLLGILFNFRSGCIAFTADIADMFLRIKVRVQDRGAQLFLWRGADRDREPDVYSMSSMIFGAVSSPASAIYILNKNAEQYSSECPLAVKAINQRHYMDDYLDSVDRLSEAKQLIEEVSRIHAGGGFQIRGWTTNSAELRESLPTMVPGNVSLDFSPDKVERTLGMLWSPDTDSLRFDLTFKRLPEEITQGKIVPTKRQFLKFIMSVFDPLGILYPCVIQSRIIMQKVWQSGIQWDEQLRDSEAELWFRWLSNLSQLEEVDVPRWYGLRRDKPVELHVFGDASELAYAAVAYIVGESLDGQRRAAMVMGKARVTPVKIVSIPRLELQAAVLACRLAETVKGKLDMVISKQFLWTDSKTVYHWVHSDAREFQKFVSHRLAEIDCKSQRSDWRWVPTLQNPADEATRMDWPNTNNMWVSGPSFLCDPQVQWPSPDVSPPAADEEQLERVHIVQQPAEPLLDVTRVSTWTRAVRVMARVLAFVGRARRTQPRSTEVTADNVRAAETYLLKSAQAQDFKEEIRAREARVEIPKGSRIKALDPELDEEGLLRVGGRLRAALELSYDEKHPIILDGRNPIARLIVRAHHTRALHANHETVINSVRERYWVLRLRATVKKIVAECQLCRVKRAQPCAPKMGNLPATRVATTRRAFVHCGLDYFGPMDVVIGRRREKRWGVLFTCLATRAVHLELAASLSADSAILALRRLIARRGQPAIIMSDRGTNFVGANTELRAALRELEHDKLREAVSERGIEWRYNPPASPHMGGAWERLVRSVKNALRATLHEKAPREEVLYTLLVEAELVINSRPLTYVPDDPEQPTVITPNHLLLGTASGAAPMKSAAPRDVDARRQWVRVNALADEFWRRWLREYLPSLQERQKWHDNGPNVKVNDIVIVADGNQPRNQWPRGIVSAVHAGSDNIVRSVDIRTAHGTLRRPAVKVIVIPTDRVIG
ncbi:hypothetical protein ABMA28_007977 [Loxostege sticticalis]|uniref:Integrase catalytic domain-containing protein n=1 Tax=Loxostege sticticalis TaxID=481309 RepID=A0ABD0SJI3_LOXSC